MDSQKRVDRFGWYADEDYVMSPEEKKLAEEESQKEHARETKWAEMVNNWDMWMTHKRDKVAKRIKKGIPDAFRSKAWNLLTNADASLNASPENIQMLLDKPALEVYKVIEEDLPHTFPQTSFFSAEENIQSLKRVLCAYAQINQELGYRSGMSFFAGTFLMYLDENAALWAFYNVLTGFRTFHRDFFTDGAPRVLLASKMLEELVKDKFPKIHKHFAEIGLKYESFAGKWFIPAFLTFKWPAEMMLRLFDLFLFYGTRSLLSFALLIFARHKDEFATDSLEKINEVLSNPAKSSKMKDWRSCLDKIDKLWINKKKYLQLLKTCGAPPERLE